MIGRMKPKTVMLRAAVGVLLVLAVAAELFALRASGLAAQLQGPQALVVLPDGQVWVHMDTELWRAGADGRLLGRDPVTGLGLPGAPAQLVTTGSNEVLATVRDHATLFWLSTAQPRVTRSVTPQWPEELRAHGTRAIVVAAHPDGRLAIATGGGHAVALFDADGRFLARTAPGTYRFTNGLWWEGEALWTTDTNRFRLKRLDGRSLRVAEDLPLGPSPGQPFLGGARATDSPDAPWRAALLRLDAAMQLGHVVALDRQGRETRFAHGRPLAPRDLAWQGSALLVSDAKSRSVLRWAQPAGPAEAFGDAALRQLWQAEDAQRLAHERTYRVSMGVAIASFVAGLALALWLAHLGRGAPPRPDDPRFAQVGTPLLPRAGLLRLWWRAFGWTAAFAAVLVLTRWPGAMAGVRSVLGVSAMLALITLLLVLGTIFLLVGAAHVTRVSRSEAFEPLFNLGPRRWLQRSAVLAQALAPDEVVHEVFSWTSAARRARVVLTDRRLLVVQPGLWHETLAESHAMADLKAVSTAPAQVGRLEAHFRWAQRLRGPSRGWLELRLKNDYLFAGRVSSSPVAARVAARLQAAIGSADVLAAPAQPSSNATTDTTALGARRPAPPRAAATLASLVLPGLGQWWQRRPGVALALFVPWASAMALWVVPVAWTLAGPRADVGTPALLVATYFGALWPLCAAWEAWRVR